MKAKTIIREALAISDPAARAAYLDFVCGDDTARRDRLAKRVADSRPGLWRWAKRLMLLAFVGLSYVVVAAYAIEVHERRRAHDRPTYSENEYSEVYRHFDAASKAAFLLIQHREEFDDAENEELEAVVRAWRAFLSDMPRGENEPVLRAKALYHVARFLSKLKRYDEALHIADSSLSLTQSILAKGDDPRLRHLLAAIHDTKAMIHFGQEDTPAAIADYEASAEVIERLATEFPIGVGIQADRATIQEALANLYSMEGSEQREAKARRLAAEAWRRVAELRPDARRYAFRYAQTCALYADQLVEKKQYQEAVDLLTPAIDYLTKLHGAEPFKPFELWQLVGGHTARAEAYEKLQQYEKAIADYDAALAVDGVEYQQTWLRTLRLNALVRADRVEMALAEVAQLRQENDYDPDLLIDFAGVYAAASEKRPDRRAEYVQEAFDLLQLAAKDAPDAIESLEADERFAALRSTKDFQTLIYESLGREKIPAPRPAE